MPGLNVYASEFAHVVAFCIQGETGFHYGDNQYAIEKSYICNLLKQSPFAKVEDKLTLWKSLRWISADKDRFTRNVNVKSSDVRRRMVLIDLEVYKALLSFIEVTAATKNKGRNDVAIPQKSTGETKQNTLRNLPGRKTVS